MAKAKASGGAADKVPVGTALKPPARKPLSTLGDRLGYPEAEAAALLGIERHVLRDCRLRGEIRGGD